MIDRDLNAGIYRNTWLTLSPHSSISVASTLYRITLTWLTFFHKATSTRERNRSTNILLFLFFFFHFKNEFALLVLFDTYFTSSSPPPSTSSPPPPHPLIVELFVGFLLNLRLRVVCLFKQFLLHNSICFRIFLKYICTIAFLHGQWNFRPVLISWPGTQFSWFVKKDWPSLFLSVLLHMFQMVRSFG